MFDDYPSPPPTPSSSRLRSISQLHTHSSPLCSAVHSHAHPYGQRASKASDIAHLLDPSYSPTRTNAYLNQIYVDHAGEAHDPDFRLFAPAGYSPKRREFLTCESDVASDADDDDADSVEAASVLYPSPKRASFDSARSASHPSYRRPDSRASDPAYKNYTRAEPRHDAEYATFAYTFEETGYASDDEPRREANKLRRRRASIEHDRPVEQAEPVAEQPRAEWTAYVPSSPCCTFRRQWHALRLRTQVAAFRARKRVSRIVSPSLG